MLNGAFFPLRYIFSRGANSRFYRLFLSCYCSFFVPEYDYMFCLVLMQFMGSSSSGAVLFGWMSDCQVPYPAFCPPAPPLTVKK